MLFLANPHHLQASTVLISSSQISFSLVLGLPINGILWYTLLNLWLLLFSVLFFRFFHGGICVNSSFLFIADNITLCGCATILFINSPANGYSHFFQLWGIMDKAAMSVVLRSLCRCLFSFLLGKQLGLGFLGHKVGVCLT